MIETFSTEDGRLQVQLYERRDLAAGPLGGSAPLQRTVTARVESVEITLAGDLSDPAITVEMTLEEFHAFFFRKIFPAVANRMNRIKKPGGIKK